MKAKLYKLIPYFIILILSLLGCVIVFYSGLNRGDDYSFHIANIYDEYVSLKNGHDISPISGNLAMGLGYGKGLFYSPLPHLVVRLFGILFDVFGISLMTTYKFVIVLSVFISGIFMYRFGLHFTKNNKVCALLASACFILYPYRLFDAFARLAFAEFFSIMFLPLFFMGLYDITHFEDKESINILAFLEIVFGASLLFMSHNTTSVFAFIFGFIYLLCHIVKIIKSFRYKKYIIYTISSIILILGICMFIMVTQMELLNTGIYTISNRSRMWTDIAHVINRTNEEFDFSGFVNIPYITKNFGAYLSMTRLIVEIIIFIVASSLYIIIDLALREMEKLHYFHLAISTAIMFLIIFMFGCRVEIYYACIITSLLYMYVLYGMTKDDMPKPERKLRSSITMWYCVGSIILLLFMLDNKFVWEHGPDFILYIQFPWRLWALVQIFAAILVGMFAYYINYKQIISLVFVVLVGLLMATNEPLLEKRMTFETDYNNKWYAAMEDELLDRRYALGAQGEYAPYVYFDGNYKSEYANSLYTKIKKEISSGSFSKDDYYFKPVVIKGVGTVEVNYAYAPVYDMDVTIDEDDTIIQIPLFYYPGYKIEATDLTTNNTIIIEGFNIDGLLSFTIDKGSYTIKSDYVGTPLRRTGIVIHILSGFSSIIALVFGIVYRKRRKTQCLKLEK